MNEKWSSIAQVQAAIDGKIPDRLPVDLHNFLPAAFAADHPVRDVLQSGELLAGSMRAAWQEFGHDMILLENGTACSAQACGAEVEYPQDSAPVVHKIPYDRLVDLVNGDPPDPFKTFPMNELLTATQILSEEIGSHVWICARADQGPFSLAAQLRGIPELMMDIALGENLDLIQALLEYSSKVVYRFAHALIEMGGRSTSIGDSLAGPELLSPGDYLRFAWPFERKLISRLSKDGIILHLHICGDTSPIFENMVTTGAPVLEIDHKTDSTTAINLSKQRACLLGNIDTGLLANGSPEEVENACRELMDRWKPVRSFILGPGCAMGADTPADNIHALVESAVKFD
jgi:uroporphyrinogen decarboxylase